MRGTAQYTRLSEGHTTTAKNLHSPQQSAPLSRRRFEVSRERKSGRERSVKRARRENGKKENKNEIEHFKADEGPHAFDTGLSQGTPTPSADLSWRNINESYSDDGKWNERTTTGSSLVHDENLLPNSSLMKRKPAHEPKNVLDWRKVGGKTLLVEVGCYNFSALSLLLAKKGKLLELSGSLNFVPLALATAVVQVHRRRRKVDFREGWREMWESRKDCVKTHCLVGNDASSGSQRSHCGCKVHVGRACH